MLSSRNAHVLVVHTILLILVLVVNDGVLVAREELAEWAAALDRRRVPGVVDEALDCRLKLFRTSSLRFLMFAGGAGGFALTLVGLRSLKSAERPGTSTDLAERPRRDEATAESICSVCVQIDRTDRVSRRVARANLQPFWQVLAPKLLETCPHK